MPRGIKNVRVCGVAEMLGSSNTPLRRLDTNRPKFRLDKSVSQLQGVTPEELEAAVLEAFSHWENACDVRLLPASSRQNPTLVIVGAKIDRAKGGVLADQQLPYPAHGTLRMRLDVAEDWGVEWFLKTVLCHELGHFLGLQHFPASPPPELMEPVLNPKVTVPQAAEIAIARKLYGPPVKDRRQEPDNVVVTIGGVIYTGNINRA